MNKTIRHNCFETNSSSTHSFTICTNLAGKPNMNFLPDEDGTISIDLQNANSGENNPQCKAALLLKFAKVMGDQESFDKIVNAIEKFTGFKIAQITERTYDNGYKNTPVTAVDISELPDGPEADEDAYNEALSELLGDAFYQYTGIGSYRSDYADIIAFPLEKASATEESIISYVFSTANGFDIEAGYDG